MQLGSSEKNKCHSSQINHFIDTYFIKTPQDLIYRTNIIYLYDKFLQLLLYASAVF
ncbi:Uncharacterised protein [Vibrio cholerae]|nr:Uncharacterised protein [Vibrio cholerae]